jgi:hypothetical protein
MELNKKELHINVGNSNGMAKITSIQADEIRGLYPSNSQQSIANAYGISQRQVSNIVNLVNWK